MRGRASTVQPFEDYCQGEATFSVSVDSVPLDREFSRHEGLSIR
jgi:hypothetical protein